MPASLKSQEAKRLNEIEFARAIFAAGGNENIRVREKIAVYEKVIKRKHKDKVAQYKAVERLTKSAGFLQETERLMLKHEKALAKQEEALVNRLIWKREEWLMRLQEIVETPAGKVSGDSWLQQQEATETTAGRMPSKEKALEMIGKAMGYYDPQVVEIKSDGLSRIADVLEEIVDCSILDKSHDK